ncbi:uncharacterized protein VICG_00044 [Vittaforma corneae ATCC 50505]|uniref:Uncharacterized protein n=1 Tax=Vittaforma corneae (strain ATCC 50505) TaxID=993615 RepID=L2GQ45_VITCO|nr:uncharacterized protein VICG_00044 [Vittaforma corneae ATCC 50505]ELA42729.1 hypothetical protein VICG_00044 [Vittaforma corneae ATCC 50505]
MWENESSLLNQNGNVCIDQAAIISMYEDENQNTCDNTQESMENKRSDVTVICPAATQFAYESENFQNTVKNISKNTPVIDCNDSYLDNICTDIDVLPSLGNFNGDIASFIGKLSKPTADNEDATQNNTLYMSNLNDTVVIDSVQSKDPSNVFHQPSNSAKLSCVRLFNESIFCSDEEPFIKKSPTLKDKPGFSIDITLEPYCEDHSNEHSC